MTSNICFSGIPVKRTSRRLIHSLTRDEMDALLPAPDLSHWRGRRDGALILTLYNTGARVSEITALNWESVQFGVSGTHDRELRIGADYAVGRKVAYDVCEFTPQTAGRKQSAVHRTAALDRSVVIAIEAGRAALSIS